MKEVLPGVPVEVNRLLGVVRQAECPVVPVGDHCYSPYPCDLAGECWSFLPEQSVFSLRHGGAKAMALMTRGILALKDIPEDVPLSRSQSIQVACTRSGQPHLSPRALRGFLAQLEYPLYFLDFETLGTAIPLYDASRPYEQVPFQYSLRVSERPGGKTRHLSFLASGTSDPRPRLLASLKQHLGTRGSIVAYNASFEKQRLSECAEYFPEHARWVDRLLPRFVDLLEPFRSFSYYHPAQDGSCSQKAVLPAMTGSGYEDLDIADGQTASLRFLDMAFGGVSREERAAIRLELKEYCGRDTLGMVRIVEELGRQGQVGDPRCCRRVHLGRHQQHGTRRTDHGAAGGVKGPHRSKRWDGESLAKKSGDHHPGR